MTNTVCGEIFADFKQKVQNVTNWDELPLFLSVEQAAQILGVGRAHIDNLARTPSFPARKMDRRTVISRDGLQLWGQGESKWQQGASLFQWQQMLQVLRRIEQTLERMDDQTNLSCRQMTGSV